MSRLWACLLAALLLSPSAGAGRWTILGRLRIWRGFVAPGPPPYAQSPASPALTFTMWAYLDPWNKLLNHGGYGFLSLFTVSTTAGDVFIRLPALYVMFPNVLHISTGWHAGGSNQLYGAVTPPNTEAVLFGQWAFLAVTVNNTASTQPLNLYYATSPTASLALLPASTNRKPLPLDQSAVFTTDPIIQTALAVLHNVTLYDRALSAAELDQVKSSTAPPPMAFTSGQLSYQASGSRAGGFVYEWLPNSASVAEAAPATNGLLNVSCPAGTGARIARILFASYGTPQGDFPSFTIGLVHANTSLAVVQRLCLDKPSCTVQANDTTFAPAPAPGVRKWLAVVAQCNRMSSSTTKTSASTTRRRVTINLPSRKLTPGFPPTSLVVRPPTSRAPTTTGRSLGSGPAAPSPGATPATSLVKAPSQVQATTRTTLGPGPGPAPGETASPSASPSPTRPLSDSTTTAALAGCLAGVSLGMIAAWWLTRRQRKRSTARALSQPTIPQAAFPVLMHAASAPAQYFPTAAFEGTASVEASNRYYLPPASAPYQNSPPTGTATLGRPRREEAHDNVHQDTYTSTTDAGTYSDD
ncbi:unnamed protein product (mitochondrion) [Plasmodiophora brassicae]|uniref:SUEL-type lectin domain-containing protein n=1 Tax=Plasmodiophora brassicae TaxID=37360 RepID=A0A3P3YDF9_PLABS|nr:unnamed protein product [Plasmodiophora brassicae]